jgi:uronate dehydrogenase
MSTSASPKPLILLTGAAGKIGRLLTPLLRQTAALRLCDLNPMPLALPGDEVLQGDLSDPDFARRASAGVEGVVHLAALVASRVSFEDTLNGNYRALLALLEACRHGNVPRFVYAGSHHILGLHPSNRVYDENSPLAPDGFYGLSKAFGEAACAMYSMRFGIRVLVVRIGNADPEVVDARRERVWVSGRDLTQLVTIGLTHPDLRHEIVYGVSRCPAPVFSNDAAARLGYQPQDDARDHHAPGFRTLDELTPADGYEHAGGFFAADPLPDPLRLT